MKMIALTSANETAMAAVAEQLLRGIRDRKLEMTVSVGIKDAHSAQAVYSAGGELWRVGYDDTHPELDVLVDRAIDDSTPSRMQHDVDQALQRFLGKTRVAA